MTNTFDEMNTATKALRRAMAMAEITLRESENVVVTLPHINDWKDLRNSILLNMPTKFCCEYEENPMKNRFEFRGIVFTFNAGRA